MPKFKDLTRKPNFKERVDPTYIADDDVKVVADETSRNADYRITQDLKKILIPIDQRIFGVETYVTPEFNCDSGLLMYQLVYLSDVGYVRAYSSNNPPTPMLGIVAERPAPTRAVIQMMGFILPKVDLKLGPGVLYVGFDGQLSLSKPGTGFVQIMGYSLGDGWLFIQPSFNR